MSASLISASGTTAPSRGIRHSVRSTVSDPGHPASRQAREHVEMSTSSRAVPVALTPIRTTPGSGASALIATSHRTGAPGSRPAAASQSASETRRSTSPWMTCVVGAAQAALGVMTAAAAIVRIPKTRRARMRRERSRRFSRISLRVTIRGLSSSTSP
ncbi:hypothetical protein M0722_14525 [Microbacterium sp. KSW4-16]|uniref:hypothetical protein n=1 Tax=Microbacterium TaxID=33882 RepID=UPI00103ED8CC|nr:MULTISPECIES: hypothetical protein [Microbacterium]MCK8468408.1 hypothetical protein [Microbacterium aurugineum]TCJ20823.1 hypothetical protein E0W80_18760 [Microbacterium sp. PI-1]